ncbi:hypothetical protein KIN20_012592 [Parelaphostrongylus tenuis]|uniref:Uncharacterized protein n=1 Tax=Parelaphostrongylus tenuis TaxID=148309 RepID=A0AAD5MB04_PARTN|nr:hypothetical protein KIN20_012592 [Parelaphostrongylus tenuis]
MYGRLSQFRHQKKGDDSQLAVKPPHKKLEELHGSWMRELINGESSEIRTVYVKTHRARKYLDIKNDQKTPVSKGRNRVRIMEKVPEMSCKRCLHTLPPFSSQACVEDEILHDRHIERQVLKKGQQKFAVARTIGHSHFPGSAMIWAGICSTGKTPMVFINRNVKINTASYSSNFYGGNRALDFSTFWRRWIHA